MARKRKKKEGFREWLSDNLRYILLILLIFALLAGLFFGVRAISERVGAPRVSSAGNTGGTSEQTVSAMGGAESGGESVSADADSAAAPSESTSSSGAEEKEGSNAAESAAAAAPGAQDAAPSGETEPLRESTENDVVKLVSSYYEALCRQDAAAVRALTDTLSTEQAERIASSQAEYSDIHVYTKEGTDSLSRVIYACFLYRNSGQPVALPGLSQMYAKKGADGTWKLIFSRPDASVQSRIDEATSAADVQELIARVKAEYDEAVRRAESIAADPEVSVPAETESTPAAPSLTPTAEEELPEEEEEEPEAAEDGEDEETGGEEEQEEALPDNVWTAVINSSCNVRSGAGYDYEVIGGVVGGTEVSVIGDIENGWWHIRADGIEGYIGGRFID